MFGQPLSQEPPKYTMERALPGKDAFPRGAAIGKGFWAGGGEEENGGSSGKAIKDIIG